MKVIDKNDVKEEEVEDAKKTTIRWLIDENLAENFAMRYFVIGKGGNTPLHSHDWEHEIFVVKGEGYIHNGNEKIKSKKVMPYSLSQTRCISLSTKILSL